MYQPVFTRQPESWREWWSAIRAFTAAWYGIPAGEVRGRDPLIRALEREADVTISPSVHEWAAYAAELQQTGIFDRAMRDTLTIGWEPHTTGLRLLTVVEGTVEWTVPLEHLAEDDPPVECLHIDDRDGQILETWRHTPTTSQFALQQLISYRRPPGGGFTVEMTASAELLDQLQAIGTCIELGTQTLIEGDDLLILAGMSPWTVPEGWDTIEVQIGASRVNSVPKILTDLIQRKGGWRTPSFPGGRGQ